MIKISARMNLFMSDQFDASCVVFALGGEVKPGF